MFRSKVVAGFVIEQLDNCVTIKKGPITLVSQNYPNQKAAAFGYVRLNNEVRIKTKIRTKTNLRPKGE